MGEPKLTLEVGGRPMLGRTLETIRQSSVDRIVVVLGADAATIRKKVRFVNEKVVVNHEYRRGMSESLKTGLAVVQDEADAVMVVLGDQPFLASETVDRLIDAYQASKAPVVVPVYHGQRGNPVLFDRSLFLQVMNIQGDAGAKSVVLRNEAALREVAVEDQGVLLDLDTPSDYAGARSRGQSKIRTRTRAKVSP